MTFEQDMIDRMARMETKLDVLIGELSKHTFEDGERFGVLERDISTLLVESAVQKRTAHLAGSQAGRKWAAGVSAAVLAAVEALRQLLS